jgi:cytochrome c oxidase cbb3-type subunit I
MTVLHVTVSKGKRMKMESLPGLFRRQNSAALAFIISGSFWFIIGTTYGLFSAIDLVSPEFFGNIPALVFGRARPVHVSLVLFGFVTSMLIGSCLYIVTVALRTRLWSEPLGWATWLFWNITVLSGPITFAFGLSQGREYTEYLWPFHVTFVITFILLIVNAAMTISQRMEESIYVSVWYLMGAVLCTPGSYFIGSVMWHPKTGAMPGLIDQVLQWFWGHTLPGLLLTPLALAAAYYVIPRIVRQPLNSHTLSLVGFWSLIAIYTHIGAHHILQTPIPNWLKTVAVVNSASMVVPVFIALANLWLTARGYGGNLLKDPAGRLVLAGTLWYLVTCIQGPFQALPFIQRVTHLTNFTIGHAHIAVLGFSGFIALGTMWHVLPDMLGRRLWSNRLVNLQFGLVLFGLSGFFVVLTIAGLIQGESWNNGETVYKVLPQYFPYMVLRAAFGILIITSAFVGFYNLIMTIFRGEPFTSQPVQREDAS